MDTPFLEEVARLYLARWFPASEGFRVEEQGSAPGGHRPAWVVRREGKTVAVVDTLLQGTADAPHIRRLAGVREVYGATLAILVLGPGADIAEEAVETAVEENINFVRVRGNTDAGG